MQSAVLIGSLATALFATIGLLAAAPFHLRGRIDQLRDEIAGIRADLARIEARLDARLQEFHG